MHENRKRVIIIGGGAAGMMAAIHAAYSGAAVTVLEAMERPGKKLLLTGNGRCNLTNMDPELAQKYHGSGAAYIPQILRQFSVKDTLQFFNSIGLLTIEKSGYVYPYSNQSQSVLEVLLAELRRQKVKTKFGEKVTHLQKTEHGWSVYTNSWHYEADSVVLACGSKAVPASGSDGSGYEIAKVLGHTIVPVSPALTGVVCGKDYSVSANGVRCKAKVTLLENQKPIACDTGELQWTKNGISGIVVFQVSRFVSTAKNLTKLNITIDLFPDFSSEALLEMLISRAKQLPDERAVLLFSGMINDRLIPVLFRYAGIKEKTICKNLDHEQLNAAVESAKNYMLSVIGVRDFEQCQVCTGGISVSEINIETMESTLCTGLYFAGEIIDIDGPCGGYNLQWAWTSGAIAGKYAAQTE